MRITIKELAAAAQKVSKNAYAPYSHFKVGAALVTEDGTIVTGCNVENASYGGTICAERNAATTAVALGYTDFEAIAIYSETSPPAGPCGLCRQFLGEFNPEMKIYLTNDKGEVIRTSLKKLMPMPFTPASFKTTTKKKSSAKKRPSSSKGRSK